MKIGIVTATNTSKCQARVKFEDLDGIVSSFLPVMQKKSLRDKQYWMPDINEHVVVLMDENEEFGVILGAIYSDADTPPVSSQDKSHVLFDDGTSVEYDRAAHLLAIDVKGDVLLTVTGTVTSNSQGLTTVKSATGILMQAPTINMESYTGGNSAGTIKGTLHVTQNIKGDADIIDAVRSMEADRNIYNGHTHPGDSGGTTGVPNQQE